MPGKILAVKASAGTAVKKGDITALGIPSQNTTYSDATTTKSGLMSASDKVKLDGIDVEKLNAIDVEKLNGIEVGANKTIVDDSLSNSSTNPVQNKVVNTAINNLSTLVGDTSVSTQIENAIAEIPKLNIENGDGEHSLRGTGAADHFVASYAVSFGKNTVASNEASFAEGYNTTASGLGAHAEGHSFNKATDYITSSSTNDEIITAWRTHAFTLAEGDLGSHAEGASTLSLGQGSHAEGSHTIASGDHSHSEGYNTTASGGDSHAEGRTTKALGEYSHAEGIGTYAKGEGSHTEGYQTYAEGAYSHAEGISTFAHSEAQHAQGRFSCPDGYNKYAHIVGNGESEGSRSNAHTLDWNGVGWFAGGLKVGGTSQDDGAAVEVALKTEIVKNIVDVNGGIRSINAAQEDDSYSAGTTSFSFGHGVKSPGRFSFAEGGNTTASGTYSHAEGYNTIAFGDYSHAEGSDTIASGTISHVEGYGTIAASSYQHVQGKFNIEDSANKYAHIVGNGIGVNYRSNAHTLDWNGVGWFKGGLKVGGTSQDDSNAKSVLLTPDEDDAFALLLEMNLIEPVTNEDGSIYTNENGAMYTIV